MSLFQAFSQVTGYSAEYLGTYLWTTKNLLKLIQMNVKVFFLFSPELLGSWEFRFKWVFLMFVPGFFSSSFSTDIERFSPSTFEFSRVTVENSKKWTKGNKKPSLHDRRLEVHILSQDFLWILSRFRDLGFE
jgi:hypothetical protein